MPGPRRRSREAALQVLYAADAVGDLGPDEVGRVFEQVAAEFSLPRAARDRAAELCEGVARNLERIDGAISRASAHWKVPRLASVDRNVLRVAAYELMCGTDTPPEVAIDEAVEIARRYAGERSPAFVNGVLDELWRSHRGEAP
ncbi:MAG: transcription antitermination factor NusB [Proteobacteria bacterium]|nr:transcription antitermination factor NusB [Pseudomonadota bacterium]